MLQPSDYDIYIFDCDGVILDSNQLKIKAMKNTLEQHFYSSELIGNCVDYFRKNFGKSRFHHIEHFLENILSVEDCDKYKLKDSMLSHFSEQCLELYSSAEITPGFILFIEQCDSKKYVASGSAQEELRTVLKKRGLAQYFDDIFGSPTPKSEIIKYILEKEQNNKAIMIGDAESDMLAARDNNIDFAFYSPYSNVKPKMLEYCSLYNYKVIDKFSEVRN